MPVLLFHFRHFIIIASSLGVALCAYGTQGYATYTATLRRRAFRSRDPLTAGGLDMHHGGASGTRFYAVSLSAAQGLGLLLKLALLCHEARPSRQNLASQWW